MKTNLEGIAHLVTACATCGVLHANGYRCASMRREIRRAGFYPVWTSTPTIVLAKGTR